MDRMGASCSKSSRRASQNSRSTHNPNFSFQSSGYVTSSRCFSRHSLSQAIPDDSISNFYPPADNYVSENDGTRSPKSLAQLCTDSLCRSLPYLNGELPPGLPPDVVDDIIDSLVKHNALNTTTLKILRNCEISSLRLAGCRGVTDEWLSYFGNEDSIARGEAANSQPEKGYQYMNMTRMDIDDDESERTSEVFYNASCEHSGRCSDESSSTSSYVSASSTLGPSQTKGQPSSLPNYTDHSVSEKMPARDQAVSSPIGCSSITSNMTLLDLRGSHRLTDKGLRQLSDLSALEVARLDNCHSLIGRGLLAFSMSHRLHTLSLANCRRLTDEAIINISHLTLLEALSLDGCRCLTDHSLAALSGLYLLKKLDLSQCDLITDRGLEELENIEGLEELSLGWCRNISNNGLDILTNQPGRSFSLKILSLARCLITDTGVDYLRRLENLIELDLNGCSNISSSALGNTLYHLTNLTNLDVSYCPGILRTSWQGKINNLKSLQLCYAAVGDNHMSRFTDLPALEELNFDSCPIGDWTIAHLAQNEVVPNLQSLDLADTDLSDAGMVHLAKFTNLRSLSLFYCNITNTGLRHISQLTRLEALNLDSREIGDDGLWHLRNLKNLKSLDIFSGRITDGGCLHISRIKSLESLELCGGGIGDPGCAMLATLENLTCLNLSQNDRITNRGAAALSALMNLKALNLSNTRVNSGALVHFGHLLQLQSLALYGCRGMEDMHGLDRLQKELPSLKCMRLNNGSDDDGIVMQQDGSDDEEESSDGSNEEFEGIRGFAVAQYRNSDSEEDEDSHMEDDTEEIDFEYYSENDY